MVTGLHAQIHKAAEVGEQLAEKCLSDPIHNLRIAGITKSQSGVVRNCHFNFTV